MTIFRLDDLVTPMTRAEVQASIYQALKVVGVNTANWRSDSAVRAAITGVSVLLSAYSDLTSKITRAGFLELSTGDWLTATAYYVYGIQRAPATHASGELVLANSGGGVFTADPGDLIVRRAAGEPGAPAEFRNTAAFSLGAGQTIVTGVQAVEPGAASSVNPGTLTELVTPMIGVTCSNPAPMIGNDAQTDQDLRRACAESLGSRTPCGAWDSYASAIRRARRADGSALAVSRTRSIPDGHGGVDILIALDGGPVPGDPSDPQTDLGLAQQACEQWAQPLAVRARIHSATPVSVAITFELWMYDTSGLTEDEIIERVYARLRRFFAGAPIGGDVADDAAPGRIHRTSIVSAIASEFAEVFHVALTTPSADVILAVSEVAVMGVVTPLGVHQVPRPQSIPGLA